MVFLITTLHLIAPIDEAEFAYISILQNHSFFKFNKISYSFVAMVIKGKDINLQRLRGSEVCHIQ